MRRRLLLPLLLVAAFLASGIASAANPYPPPSSGSGRVDPSRIRLGECAVFSGDGFMPGGAVAVEDNGSSAGGAIADPEGRFSKRLCYGTDDKPGRHVLTGTGSASAGGSLSVSAVLIVEGGRRYAGASDSPTTGADGNAAAPGSGSVEQPVGITEPGAVAGPGPGADDNVRAPLSGDNTGAWRLAAGVFLVAAALLASCWLLLLLRRDRRSRRSRAETQPAPSPAA